MTGPLKKWLFRGVGVLLLGVLGLYGWQKYLSRNRDNGLVSGNGRIEAVEIDVAAKSSSRIKDILVREGELVAAGQVVAVLDTEVLEAQLHQAEAQLEQAQSAVATARSQVSQRESEKAAAQALVGQRQAELDNARRQAERAAKLFEMGVVSRQAFDDDNTRLQTAAAVVSAAQAQLAAAEAGIATARTQIIGAQSAVEGARATIARIRAEIEESTLKTPRAGRVQYRVAQPGEVVGGGGRVLNLLDLSDVYMTFFLPTAAAGRVAIGSEVRLVLDAAPQYVIPAKVSFVAAEAQFTPKTVETASEREKLMFRIRAQLPEELLKKHIGQVKTGLPGMAYVRLNPAEPWPERLRVQLPQ